MQDSAGDSLDTGLDRAATVNACPACGSQYSPDLTLCPEDGTSLIKQLPDPLIGTMLPRHYRITGKLGRGAMSVVYRGVYEPLSQPVAIKLLKSHLVSDTQTFKRFQQEAKTAGALEHPNIVDIFDFGVTEQGVPYLIMELLHGQSLAERLRAETSLPIENAIEIFLQAGDALSYTHQRGIVHRDVKPSNLLLEVIDGRDTVKIVDFGIAKLQSYEGNPSLNLTATGEVFGTPLYVSPEQAMGKTIDLRADIYSLGCVMYEAIVGRPAFSGPTAFDVIRMQITVDPMPMNKLRPDLEIPPPLIAAVARCMAKHPDDRYQSMEDLLSDLRRAQSLTATMRLTSSKSRSSISMSSESRTFGDTNALNKPRVPSSDSTRTAVRDTPAAVGGIPTVRGSTSRQTPPVVLAVRKKPVSIVPFLLASVSGCIAGVILLLIFAPKSFVPDAPVSISGGEPTLANTPAQALENMDPTARFHVYRALELYNRGDYLKAIDEDKEAIKILHSKLQTVAQAVTYSDLCKIYLAAGNIDEAYEAGIKGVDLLAQSAPDQDLNMAVVMESLAQAAVAKKDLKQADALYAQALEKKRKVLPANDLEIATTLHSLAVTKALQGDGKRAEQLYKDALGMRKRKPDQAGTKVATTLSCLGTLYYEQGNYAQAESALTEARNIDAKYNAYDAISRDNICLAKLYERMKKPEKVESCLREALKSSEQAHGHGSPRLVSRLTALASFLKTQHKMVESEALERQAASIAAAK